MYWLRSIKHLWIIRTWHMTKLQKKISLHEIYLFINFVYFNIFFNFLFTSAIFKMFQIIVSEVELCWENTFSPHSKAIHQYLRQNLLTSNVDEFVHRSIPGKVQIVSGQPGQNAQQQHDDQQQQRGQWGQRQQWPVDPDGHLKRRSDLKGKQSQLSLETTDSFPRIGSIHCQSHFPL